MANQLRLFKSNGPVMIDVKSSFNRRRFKAKQPHSSTLRTVSFHSYSWPTVLNKTFFSPQFYQDFRFSDEIYSVTTQTIHPDEIEHEEEVDQQPCVNDATVLDAQEEEVEANTFALAMSDDSECEDKEYMGK